MLTYTLDNFKLVLFIVLIFLFLFGLYSFFKRKGIGLKKYLALMDLGEELKKEIKSFVSKKTTINFTFINLGEDNYDKIRCEWINSEISIENKNEFSSEIDNFSNINGTNYYINTLLKQKIELIKNNRNKEFIIDIYLHQNNNYYIISNTKENETYSLDIIYYSKNKDFIPEKLIYEKNDLILDDYNLENMRRICLVNIEKNSFINFVNSISNLKLTENEEIFEREICDFLLNIKINNKDELKSSLFINQHYNEVYNLNSKELDILKRFKEDIVMNYIKKYKNYKTKDITKEISKNFKDTVNNFVKRNFSPEGKEDKKNENINFTEETIPLKKDEIEDDIMIDIIEPFQKKNDKKSESQFKIKMNEDIDLIFTTLQLENLILNYFNTSFDERFVNEAFQNDFEIVEILCYLKLSTSAAHPLESIISFYNTEKNILKEAKELSMKEKIKIICCIKSHLMENLPKRIKLIKMIDLPENSPYLCGELMYRSIIKNLTDKSKLKFAFLQLNSGSGYDFISKNDCYLLKMIPLIVMKSHLLHIDQNYFFTYSNINTDEFAFFDQYSKIVSINEIKVFESENIENEENEDNSIKVGLLNFHEKGGHRKYGRKDKSPRFLISDLCDDYSDYTKEGESGNVLEVMLLGNSNNIAAVLTCKNLSNLADYKLFTDKDGKNLLREITEIIKDNGLNVEISAEKKNKNNASRTIEGSKYSNLKSNRIHKIKKKINELKENK